MTFAEKLQKILDEKNITAYKLCKEIEIASNSMNNWKNGSFPTIDKFEKIILYLDIKPEELLNIEKKENENLSKEEKIILQAYRKAIPDMKNGVKKLLDIPETSQKEKLQTFKTG